MSCLHLGHIAGRQAYMHEQHNARFCHTTCRLSTRRALQDWRIFLTDNLSSHGKKVHVNCSMNAKMTMRDVTTAYVTETAAGASRSGNQDYTEKSTG
jgi:hypothetical protein